MAYVRRDPKKPIRLTVSFEIKRDGEKLTQSFVWILKPIPLKEFDELHRQHFEVDADQKKPPRLAVSLQTTADFFVSISQGIELGEGESLEQCAPDVFIPAELVADGESVQMSQAMLDALHGHYYGAKPAANGSVGDSASIKN